MAAATAIMSFRLAFRSPAYPSQGTAVILLRLCTRKRVSSACDSLRDRKGLVRQVTLQADISSFTGRQAADSNALEATGECMR
jgi:hypothetical protein